MGEIAEGSFCGIGFRRTEAGTAFAAAVSQAQADQPVSGALKPGQTSQSFAGRRKVGQYTDSEQAVPDDAQLRTPFAGVSRRADGTVGIVTDEDGAESVTGHFSDPLGDDSGKLSVEAGRYRLIWTPFCPYATRTKIVIDLLGIGEDVISTGRVDPVKTKDGWAAEKEDELLPGIHFLNQLYENATVPTLVDVKSGKAVNNDYHRLPEYFETVWKPYFGEGAPDLYPERLRVQIDRLNRILFNDVQNAAYAAGLAENESEYEHWYRVFFDRLDALNDYLGRYSFLMGGRS